MAKVRVPTLEFMQIEDLVDVKLVFYQYDITAASWKTDQEKIRPGYISDMTLISYTNKDGLVKKFSKSGDFEIFLPDGSPILDDNGDPRTVSGFPSENSRAQFLNADGDYDVYSLAGTKPYGRVLFKDVPLVEKVFRYDAEGKQVNRNHILFFGQDDSGSGASEGVLLAIQNLGSDELPMTVTDSFILSAAVSSGDDGVLYINSNFLTGEGAESIGNIIPDYSEHVERGEYQGLDEFENDSRLKPAIHPYLYHSRKDHDNESKDTVLISDIGGYIREQAKSRNIICLVDEQAVDSDVSVSPTLKVAGSGDSTFYVSNSNRRYSHALQFYFNRTRVNQLLQSSFSNVACTNLGDYDFSGEKVYLGFNDRSGPYLYQYKFNVLDTGYSYIILYGSNGNTKVDIYIFKTPSDPVDENGARYQLDPEYRIKINHWYDRLYFVFPYFPEEQIMNGTKNEMDALRYVYTVYPSRLDFSKYESEETSSPHTNKSFRPKPFVVTDGKDGEDGDSDRKISYNVYIPAVDANGRFADPWSGHPEHSPEANTTVGHNMDTLMVRMFDSDENFEGYDKAYMLEFSDIGDVLVNLKYNAETDQFDTAFFNIFGDSTPEIRKDTSGSYTLSAGHIFNTYDLEGRLMVATGGTGWLDQHSLDALGGFYNTSAQQLKYLIRHGYVIVYTGSAFTIGYDQTKDMYLILFKCDYSYEAGQAIDRVRTRIPDAVGTSEDSDSESGSESWREFSIIGNYLVFRDGEDDNRLKCRFVDGTPFRSMRSVRDPGTDQVTEVPFENETSETLFGIPLDQILAADRGVIVTEDTSSGEFGARRVTSLDFNK